MDTLTGHRTPRRRWAHILGTGATALLAAGTVASTAGAATPTNAPIAATGSVAALSASSMEVQNPSSGQTTVNWTTTTQFSKTATESVSAIAVGDCVTATGTPSKKSKTTIAARNLTVTMPNSSGACSGTSVGGRGLFGAGSSAGGPPGGGQFFRTNGGGAGSGRPAFGGGTGSGAPKGAPSGNFRRLLGNISIASGKVTAHIGSTITISGILVSPGSFSRPTSNTKSSNSSKSKKVTAPKVQTLKVTTSSSTPVSATQSVASSALAVGDCVSAFGPGTTNGSITASTVRITSTGGASCTGGFQFSGGGAGGGSGA